MAMKSRKILNSPPIGMVVLVLAFLIVPKDKASWLMLMVEETDENLFYKTVLFPEMQVLFAAIEMRWSTALDAFFEYRSNFEFQNLFKHRQGFAFFGGSQVSGNSLSFRYLPHVACMLLALSCLVSTNNSSIFIAESDNGNTNEIASINEDSGRNNVVESVDSNQSIDQLSGTGVLVDGNRFLTNAHIIATSESESVEELKQAIAEQSKRIDGLLEEVSSTKEEVGTLVEKSVEELLLTGKFYKAEDMEAMQQVIARQNKKIDNLKLGLESSNLEVVTLSQQVEDLKPNYNATYARRAGQLTTYPPSVSVGDGNNRSWTVVRHTNNFSAGWSKNASLWSLASGNNDSTTSYIYNFKLLDSNNQSVEYPSSLLWNVSGSQSLDDHKNDLELQKLFAEQKTEIDAFKVKTDSNTLAISAIQEAILQKSDFVAYELLADKIQQIENRMVGNSEQLDLIKQELQKEHESYKPVLASNPSIRVVTADETSTDSLVEEVASAGTGSQNNNSEVEAVVDSPTVPTIEISSGDSANIPQVNVNSDILSSDTFDGGEMMMGTSTVSTPEPKIANDHCLEAQYSNLPDCRDSMVISETNDDLQIASEHSLSGSTVVSAYDPFPQRPNSYTGSYPSYCGYVANSNRQECLDYYSSSTNTTTGSNTNSSNNSYTNSTPNEATFAFEDEFEANVVGRGFGQGRALDSPNNDALGDILSVLGANPNNAMNTTSTDFSQAYNAYVPTTSIPTIPVVNNSANYSNTYAAGNIAQPTSQINGFAQTNTDGQSYGQNNGQDIIIQATTNHPFSNSQIPTQTVVASTAVTQPNLDAFKIFVPTRPSNPVGPSNSAIYNQSVAPLVNVLAGQPQLDHVSPNDVSAFVEQPSYCSDSTYSYLVACGGNGLATSTTSSYPSYCSNSANSHLIACGGNGTPTNTVARTTTYTASTPSYCSSSQHSFRVECGGNGVQNTVTSSSSYPAYCSTPANSNRSECNGTVTINTTATSNPPAYCATPANSTRPECTGATTTTTSSNPTIFPVPSIPKTTNTNRPSYCSTPANSTRPECKVSGNTTLTSNTNASSAVAISGIWEGNLVNTEDTLSVPTCMVLNDTNGQLTGQVYFRRSAALEYYGELQGSTQAIASASSNGTFVKNTSLVVYYPDGTSTQFTGNFDSNNSFTSQYSYLDANGGTLTTGTSGLRKSNRSSCQ